MNPQSLALRALATLGYSLALLLGGVWMGHHLSSLEATAAQAKLMQAQRLQADKDRRAADARTEALTEQLRAQGRYANTLEERSRHAAPLAVIQSPVTSSAPRAAACRPVQPTQPVFTDDAAAAPRVGDTEAGVAASPAVQLSLGAISLWNSALAGADVAAGACSPADPASPACAAASTAGLEDAWANHRSNALSCAEDRARLTQLIALIKQRQDGARP